jgi:hypothetical protein
MNVHSSIELIRTDLLLHKLWRPVALLVVSVLVVYALVDLSPAFLGNPLKTYITSLF